MKLRNCVEGEVCEPASTRYCIWCVMGERAGLSSSVTFITYIVITGSRDKRVKIHVYTRVTWNWNAATASWAPGPGPRCTRWRSRGNLGSRHFYRYKLFNGASFKLFMASYLFIALRTAFKCHMSLLLCLTINCSYMIYLYYII